MATYAIGDLQGCYDSLRILLDELNFDPANDTLWLVGDLVCRGKKSLETLRFIRSLKDRAVCVLGNHDISLIAAHYGAFKPHKSLNPIMEAPDRGELVDWLRQLPLLHIDRTLGYCMAHAGISPEWDLDDAVSNSKQIESILQGNKLEDWFKQVYHDKPKRWSTSLQGIKRQRYILNSFTRMRFCHRDGKLNFKQKLSPRTVQQEKRHLMPWFDVPSRIPIDLKIIIGHWSTLGFYETDQVVALDTGCVWSGTLTAYQLDANTCEKRHSVQCN